MMLKNSHLSVAIILVLLGLHLGCVMPSECRHFFKLPLDQEEAQFRNYPIQKQVDIYICGMDLEPPAIEFAQKIADEGDKVVPYLLARLNEEKSEDNKAKVIYIFTWMADRGELHDSQTVIKQLKLVNSAMEDDFYKKRAQEYIDQIERAKAVE